MITQEVLEVKPQKKTIVRFNRQLRQWQAINGQVRNFGSGRDAKRDCLMFALEHDRSELAEVVKGLAEAHDNSPYLLDRLLKAASLLSQGYVYENGRVRSQSSPDEFYTVFWSAELGYHCDCLDFENGLQRQAGQAQWGGVNVNFSDHPLCKHCLAVELAWQVGAELPSEPIPFGPTQKPALDFSNEPIEF